MLRFYKSLTTQLDKNPHHYILLLIISYQSADIGVKGPEIKIFERVQK